MMRLFYKILFLIMMLMASTFANDWSASLTVDPFPGPYMSDWQTDPTIAQLEVRNGTPEQEVIIIYLEVFNGDGATILQSHSRRILCDPDQILLITPGEYLDWNVNFINQNFKEKTIQTGMFPEGDYEATIKIINLWGTELVPEQFTYFSITQPEPPELIYPVEEEIVYDDRPVFQWMEPGTQKPIIYSLKIVEVLDNQLSLQALTANYPHYENFNLLESGFQYPMDALPLKNGKQYAWRITALDLTGKPATKNNGQSQVGEFQYSGANTQATINLIAPANEEVLFNNRPLFQWMFNNADLAQSEQFRLKVVPVLTGQSASMAIRANQPTVDQPINLNESDYFSPVLPDNQRYAWQIIDEFENNSSHIYTFNVFSAASNLADYLPEKLPVLSNQAAYIKLRENEHLLGDYTISPDSTEMTVSGSMMLSLPSLSAMVPEIQVNGNLTFDLNSLAIKSGSFTGNLPADKSSILNLTDAGLPIIINQVQYNGNQNQINCSAVPIIFDQVLSNISLPLEINSAGEIIGTILSSANKKFDIAGNGAIAFGLETISGSISGVPADGTLMQNLNIAGTLSLSSAKLPVELSLNGEEAQLKNFSQANGQLTIPIDHNTLTTNNLTCNHLTWRAGEWQYRFDFDGDLGFKDLNRQVANIQNITITENGMEFPEVSKTDLNISDFLVYGDVAINPVNFRMPAQIFDWFAMQETPEFFFDLDIKLPELPNYLAQLDDIPFRMNNAEYRSGEFSGQWNERNFAPAEMFAINDSINIGIDKITGEFQSAKQAVIHVAGAIDLPQFSQPINFNEDQIQLTPDGFFAGNVPNLPMNLPIRWSDDISIHPQSLSLNMEKQMGIQFFLLDIDGDIQFRDMNGQVVSASGQGMFDPVSNGFQSANFTINAPFVLGLMPVNPLFGIQAEAGAVIDESGLHLDPTGNLLLSDGNDIGCTFSGKVDVTLPDWRLSHADVNFQENFSLVATNLANLQWQTMKSSPNLSEDYLQLRLPDFPKISNHGLLVYSDSRSELKYQGDKYTLKSEFSHDFRFDISRQKVGAGKVDFLIENQKVATLDSTGLHLGQYFGNDLASQKIGLPDTNTAYIDLAANSDLIMEDKTGQKRIYTPNGKFAKIHFPVLRNYSDSIPQINAEIDMMIDAATNAFISGTIASKPKESMALNKALITCQSLKFTNNKWSASVAPMLPKFLEDAEIAAQNINFSDKGFNNFNNGYSAFQSLPKDSLVLGDYLTIYLDGFRFIHSDLQPKVMISGDISSPIFNGEKIHFTSELHSDSSDFVFQSLNKVLDTGDAEFKLDDNSPTSRIAMNSMNPEFFLSGELSLAKLAAGFSVGIRKLAIKKDGITAIQNRGDEKLSIFGTDLIFDQYQLSFNKQNKFKLLLNGNLVLWGDTLAINGLRVKSNCTLADTMLFQKNNGKKLNSLLSLTQLKIKNDRLRVNGEIKPPDPLSGQQKTSFKLVITPDGSWLDKNGNGIDNKTLAILDDENSKSIKKVLGDNNFKITGYLTKIEFGMKGDDNRSGEGFADFQMDTYWPQKTLISDGDSALVRTTANFTFGDKGLTNTWQLEAPENDITTVLDDKTFLTAAALSMQDTSGFKLNFNGTVSLPLPADIVKGEVELIDCSITKNLFKLGKLHTGEASVAGLTLELLDFHYVKDGPVKSSEIKFSETHADVKDTTYQADFYLSFGANLSTELSGFEAGVDRFVIFKSADQFHLLVDRANCWIGDQISFKLNLVGSIWEKQAGTEFRWLVGGNLEGNVFENAPFKGGAVVGEVSYREVINLNNQPEVLPGFGLFLSAKGKVDLKPIPIELTGAGAGFFWNPSKEIRNLVKSHLGFTQDISGEFDDILSKYDDDMMTLWEIYLYGEGNIPKKKTLTVKALLTLATDRIAIDAKATPSDKADLSKVVDLTGWIDAECAWAQDFSEFKYLAGHIKVGGRPAESAMIFKLPETHATALDFVVTGDGQFAMSGYLETTLYSQIDVDLDFTFGLPGFVFDGSIGYGFNIAQILKVSAGMDVMVYLKWLEPVKFGGYVSVWVEGSVLDDWLAGFRGEMGAAIMGAPDFYLYGYAEMEGTILGVSKTLRAWAKWEKDGGMSAGTGADPTLVELIEESKETAEEIMAAVEELKGELGMADVLAGISNEELEQMLTLWKMGMGNFYVEAWLKDVEEMKSVARDIIDDLDDDEKQTATDDMARFIDDLNTKLHPSGYLEKIDALDENVKELKPVLTQLETDLQERTEDFEQSIDNIATQLNTIDFGLDTLLAYSEISPNPLQNPAQYTGNTIEGATYPEISFDAEVDQNNQANYDELVKLFEQWLADVETKIINLRKSRREVYTVLGPDGKSSQLHEEIMEPVLITNNDYITAIEQINADFKDLYKSYNRMTFPWNSDDALTWFAEGDDHRTMSNARRSMAIGHLGISMDDLSDNPIDMYRQLGNLFYRAIPKVLMQNTIQQTDSLLLEFQNYYTQVQKAINQQHQILTTRTDQLWDKYAELSSKLYTILEKYDGYAQSHQNENFVLKDSVGNMVTEMESEFLFPAIDYDVTVSEVEGFKPIVVELSHNSDDKIVEHATIFDNEDIISFGDADKVKLEYLLKHGVSYWYENKLGEVVYPFTDAETRTFDLTPRFRNRAGLSTTITPKTVTLHGKDWKYGNPENEADDNIEAKNIFLCKVKWPYPGRNQSFYYENDQEFENEPINFTSNRDHLDVYWTLENRYGLSDYNPVPAYHEITLKQGRKVVYGPEAIPMTGNAVSDTFRARIDGLNLKANNGKPVRITVKAFDAAGLQLGNSSAMIQNQRYQPNQLFIDTSPPVWANNSLQRIYPANNQDQRIFYDVPLAKDEIKLKNDTYSIALDSEKKYEYKVVGWQEDLSAGERQQFTDSSQIIMPWPGRIDFGYLPYRDSLKIALRASNSTVGWNTGYSPAKEFSIPKAYENELPKPPKFKVTGIADNKLDIEITEPGSDQISGIERYPWKIVQYDYRAAEPFIEIWEPDSFYIPVENVTAGARITVALPAEKFDPANDFEFQLYAMDYTGNRSYSKVDVTPTPLAPEYRAKVLPGLPPYDVEVTVTLNDLVARKVNKVTLQVGKTENSDDIYNDTKALNRMYTDSRIEFRGNDTLWVYDWEITLPAEIKAGQSVFMSIKSEKSGLESAFAKAEIPLYSPMFSEVRTNDNGYLLLPIIEDAFDGTREATEMRYAVGFYMPDLEGQNRYQLTFHSLEKINELQQGNEIVLPVKAADVLPKALIGLQVKSADNDHCFTYLETEITPPNIELDGDISVRNLEYNRFAYDLKLKLKMGDKIQRRIIGVGSAKAKLMIGAESKTADLRNLDIELIDNGYTEKQLILPDSIAAFDRIYLTARGTTAYGKKTPDSTVIVLNVPWPEKFCEKPTLSINNELMVDVIRHGFRNKQTIAGYKIALGSDENLTVRPYPDQVDISTADWQPGKTITTPVMITVGNVTHVGIKAVNKSADDTENILEISLQPKPAVKVVPGITSYYSLKLNISGRLTADLLANIQPRREVYFGLFEDDQEVTGGSMTANVDGVISKRKDLPDDIEFGQQYKFKSWYWHTESAQHVTWDTIIRMPSEPLFNTLEVNDDDRIALTISQIGFHGNADLAGYQFAIGTADDPEANRNFPARGTYDFSPAEVQAESQLQLPGTIGGLPTNCSVTLRAVSISGEIHKTTQSIRLRPPIPRVVSLMMDTNGNFTAEFTSTSVDIKCKTLDFWIKEETDGPYRSIAFKSLQASSIDPAKIEFDSRFEPADVGKTFLFEGLNIGDQINSPYFQYRFKIEMSGNDYLVVPFENND